jgi:hypothetical protein
MSVRSRGIALAAALAALAFAAPAAQANVGGFAGGDGTQTAGGCSSVLDWSCLSPSQMSTTIDPAAPNDNIFVGSNKENDIDNWTLGLGTVSPQKADVQGVWSYSFTDPSRSHNYLALAFKRLAGMGDSYVALELNQKNTKYVNTAGSSITCRTDGDVVITFQISPSTTTPVNIYKWSSSGAPCAAGAGGSFSSAVPMSSGAELALNGSAVTNYLSTNVFGTSFPADTFGEAAVDLTALANAVSPGAACEFFNHMQVTTRNSTTASFSSDMADYVDGGAIAARACGTPLGSGNGGGSTCTPTASVAITSPIDGYVDPTNSVTLTGTSDQSEVQLLDGNVSVVNVPVTSNSWTVTLSNVADGSHSYSAIAADANSCTTASNVVGVTVQTSTGSGGGSTATGGSTSASSITTSSTSTGTGSTKGKSKPKYRGAVCSSKRKFLIRIRTHRLRLVSATVKVNGKLVKTLHGKRITAPIDLRGLPRGGFTITIRARASNGRILIGKRAYHTCTPRKSKKTIPVL